LLISSKLKEKENIYSLFRVTIRVGSHVRSFFRSNLSVEYEYNMLR